MAKSKPNIGTGPFKCDVCGQTFSSETALKEHSRTMHPGRTGQYRCEACGQLFDTEIALKEHRRLMHPEREKAPSS